MPRRERLSRTRQRLSRTRTALLACSLVGLLAGCSSAVPVQSAPDGDTAACADVVALLPAVVAGAARRDTTGGPGTAAWGDPAILLRCGEEAVVVTALPCVGVPLGNGDEVDWVVLASDSSGAIVRAYGRDPAVEVEVPASYGPAPVGVLPELGEAVAAIPATSVCVD